jgi:hypothetical protein
LMQASLINIHLSLVLVERDHPTYILWLNLFDLGPRNLPQLPHEMTPATQRVQATAALLCPSVSQTVYS